MSKQEHVIYTVVENKETKTPVILFGITKDAWSDMKRGGHQTMDLGKTGWPVVVEMYGGLTHDNVIIALKRRIHALTGAPTPIMEMKTDDIILHELEDQDTQSLPGLKSEEES